MNNTNPFQRNPFDNPSPAGFNPSYMPTVKPQLSLLALSSIVITAVSPLGICFCYPTIIGTVVALVLGHVALYRIFNSGGRQWGALFAGAALLISYPLLVLSLGLLYLEAVAPPGTPVAVSPAQERLNEAETAIGSSAYGLAHGNSPEAIALAERFSDEFQPLREGLFTKNKGADKVDKYVVYCRLTERGCAFIIKAPDLRKFEADSKKSLGDVAWLVATKVASQQLEPGTKLAVGMKGLFFYSAVMVGRVEQVTPVITSDSTDLLPFFTIDDDAKPAAVEKANDGSIVPTDAPAESALPEAANVVAPNAPAELAPVPETTSPDAKAASEVEPAVIEQP